MERHAPPTQAWSAPWQGPQAAQVPSMHDPPGQSTCEAQGPGIRELQPTSRSSEAARACAAAAPPVQPANLRANKAKVTPGVSLPNREGGKGWAPGDNVGAASLRAPRRGRALSG